ncbi:MAG: hypothetical protein Aureis2KO_17960 [Aureisphaera sp.]
MNKTDNESILLTTCPVIPVDNMNKAIRFYCDKLGFENTYDSNEYEEGPINYLVLCRKNVCLHFQLFDSIEDITMPFLKFPVRNIEALYAEFREKEAIDESRKIQNTAWNTKEFAMYDPFMTGLTFYESLKK